MTRQSYILKFNLFLLLLGFAMPLAVALGQEEPKRPDPLELPNFIIEGVERLNVKSGMKQSPKNPVALGKMDLDSLNSLEKQPSPMLPPEELPEKKPSRIFYNGFLKGEFGRYTTPSILAGYGFNLGDYQLYATGGLEYSAGHIANAGYSKIFGSITSDYIAPKKYWIFGGSKTTTTVSIDNKSYNLYAKENAISRNAFNFNANIEVEGNYEGYMFDLGGAFNTLQVSDSHSNGFDNGFSGFLSVKNYWKEFFVGLDLRMNTNSANGNGVSFLQAEGFGSYYMDKLSVRADAGFQVASASTDVSRGGVLLSGEIEYRIDKFFTLRGKFSTGLVNQTYNDLFRQNPYLHDTADVDFAYDLVNLSGSLIYHPNPSFFLSLSGSFRVADRLAIFTSEDSSTFKAEYRDGKIFRLESEANIDITSSDKLIANAGISSGSIDDADKYFTYLPGFRASLFYKKQWSETFGTQFGFNYIGERYFDINQSRKLNGYFNLNISGDYNLSKDVTLTGRLENLLNSDIIIWNGYKERNLFISIGVLWRF